MLFWFVLNVSGQEADKGWIRSYSFGVGYRHGRTVISWLLLPRLGTEFSHWIRMVTSGTGDLWGFCSALIWEIALFSALQIYFAKVTGQLWKCALWSSADFSLFSLPPDPTPAKPSFPRLLSSAERPALMLGFWVATLLSFGRARKTFNKYTLKTRLWRFLRRKCKITGR